jgi:hypothetical protein
LVSSGFQVDGAPHCLPAVYSVSARGYVSALAVVGAADGAAVVGVAPDGAAGLGVALLPHAEAAMLRTASKLRTLVFPRCIPFLTSPLGNVPSARVSMIPQ